MNKLDKKEQEMTPISYIEFMNEMNEESRNLNRKHDPKIINFVKAVQEILDMCNSIEDCNKIDLNKLTECIEDEQDRFFFKIYVLDAMKNKLTKHKKINLAPTYLGSFGSIVGGTFKMK